VQHGNIDILQWEETLNYKLQWSSKTHGSLF